MKALGIHILAVLLLAALAHNANAQPFYPAKMNGKWGYIDTNGNVAIPYQFDKASEFERGNAKATKGNSLFIVYKDKSITEIKDCHRFMPIKGGMYKAMKGALWWLAAENGTIISQTGFDRIWSHPFNEDCFMVIKDGKMGMINQSGEIYIPLEYHNLSPVSKQLYTARMPNGSFTVINDHNQRITQDTFKKIWIIYIDRNVFLAEKTNREKMLLNEKGEIIVKDHHLDASALINGFISVQKNGAFFLYDVYRNVFIDSIYGPFKSGNLPNTVVCQIDNTEVLFNRYTGLYKANWNPIIVVAAAFGRPAVARNPIYYGLLDSNNNEILPFDLLSIEIIDNQRMAIRDSTFSLRIYNYRKGDWENSNHYNSIYAGNGYLKAYWGEKSMDYYVLDEQGQVEELIQYPNVIHKAISQRTLTNWDNTMDESSNTSWRANGWYSTIKYIYGNRQPIWVMGIRYLDTVTNNFKILLQPTFTRVNVLSVPNLSLAGYDNYYGNAASKYEIENGKGTLIPPVNQCLVNDATGKKLTPFLGYIDGVDCENANTGEFRTFQAGVTTIYSKKTLKPHFKCLYASRQENGIRRVYKGGHFAYLEKLLPQNATLVDPDFIGGSGLQNSMARNRNYFGTVQLTGGEWLLEFSDGRIMKPAIAGELKIARMSTLIGGKCIVTLSNGKCGVIDTLGNTFIEPKYDYITTNTNMPGYFFCGYKNNRFGLINEFGEPLTTPDYDKIKPLGSAYLGIRHDSTFIFTPDETPIVLEYRAKTLPFDNGMGFIKNKKGYSLASYNGSVIEKNIHFKNALPFHGDYAPVQGNSGWGLIDVNGNWLWKPKYSHAKSFGYTCGVFQYRNKWIFVNTEGNKLKGPKRADAINEITPGVFVYKKNNKFGLFTETGKRISSFRFAESPFVMNDNIIALKGSRIYFFSTQGTKMGFLPGLKNGKRNQLENQQVKTIKKRGEPNFTFVLSPGQLRAYGQDSPWTELQIPLSVSRFVNLQNQGLYEAYKNDVYLIYANGAYSFVNGNDERIIKNNFNHATPMKNGLSICSLDGYKYGLLNRDGFWVCQPEYSNITQLNDSVFTYRVAYTFEIISPDGSQILNEAVDSYRVQDNLLFLKSGSRIGYYSRSQGLIKNLSD